jgi:hypothetical protein
MSSAAVWQWFDSSSAVVTLSKPLINLLKLKQTDNDSSSAVVLQQFDSSSTVVRQQFDSSSTVVRQQFDSSSASKPLINLLKLKHTDNDNDNDTPPDGGDRDRDRDKKGTYGAYCQEPAARENYGQDQPAKTNVRPDSQDPIQIQDKALDERFQCSYPDLYKKFLNLYPEPDSEILRGLWVTTLDETKFPATDLIRATEAYMTHKDRPAMKIEKWLSGAWTKWIPFKSKGMMTGLGILTPADAVRDEGLKKSMKNVHTVKEILA